jgi:hypothetical protein
MHGRARVTEKRDEAAALRIRHRVTDHRKKNRHPPGNTMAFQPYDPDSNRLRTFICHASDDKPDARIVYELLRLAGADPWLDEKKLKAGMEWDPLIIKAVQESDAVLVLLSRTSVTKEGYVQKEMRLALEQAQMMPEGVAFVFPLKLEECHPPEKILKYQVATRFEQILEALQDRAKLNNRQALTARKTKQYKGLRGKIRQVADQAWPVGAMVPAIKEPAATAPRLAAQADAGEERFRARYRSELRTTASQSEVVPFKDLATLFATLPPDDAMRPRIDQNTPRTPEEDRNVTVPARIYAVKKQVSNDYSLIIGERRDVARPIFMACRISGLPTNQGPNRILLSYMRETFRNFLGGLASTTAGYARFRPPVPVTITGSLFFNAKYRPGEVGTGDTRTTTSWEIQPVLSMNVDT